MSLKEMLITNALVFTVLITLLLCGGCTIMHSDDANWEYPTDLEWENK